jgi:hypothetical protein
LVEETGIYPEKTTDLPQLTDKLYLGTPRHERESNSQS